MGRGIVGERALVRIDPLTAAFADALAASARARARIEAEGWPVVGKHTATALARWEAQAPSRAEALATLRDASETARLEFAQGILAGWSKCVLAFPKMYSSTLSLGSLSSQELDRWCELARRDSTYDLNCVLGGSPVTFGVEVEFVGDLGKVAEALYELGLATEPTVAKDNRSRGWTVKRDITVEPFGGEVVSPVLVDLPACWRDLDRVCAALRSLGALVNRSCGLHVHLGADRLGGDVSSYLRLYLLSRIYEDLLYRIASAGGEMRHRGLTYDEPLARRGYRAHDRTLNEFRQHIAATGTDAVNFMNVGSAKNTVEFRYANGSLDARQIQALVVVYAGVLEAARRTSLSLHERPTAPLGSQAERPEDHALVRDFCDVVFPTNNRAKLRTLWLYERSRWQTEPALDLSSLAKARREALAPVFQRLSLAA